MTYVDIPGYGSQSVFKQCTKCGRQINTVFANEHEQQFHLEDDMSAVAWCDYGNHSFKKGAVGSQSFTGTEYGDDGQPISKQMDVCAEHSFRADRAITAPQERVAGNDTWTEQQ